MFLLAVDTSGLSASLALLNLETDELVATETMPSAQQTARWLTQAVHDQFQMASVKPADVSVLAVTRGPGSFTGLRIGVTFAKLFCYATTAKLVAVDSLEVLALQAAHSGPVHSVMDALRGEFYHATFAPGEAGNDGRLVRCSDTQLLPGNQLATIAQPPCCVVGILPPELRTTLAAGVTLVGDARANPQAKTVAQLGRQRAVAGEFDDGWKLQPLYLRLSYADEKHRAKFAAGR